MARWRELGAILKDWQPHYTESQYWHELWVASSFIAYPFAGNRLQQPAALLEDFNMWGLMREWLEHNNKLPKAKDLPRMEDT